MRVIKTTYSEDGISMDNVYYDNVMHICVYEGKKSLFASDVTKQMFDKVLPVDFLEQFHPVRYKVCESKPEWFSLSSHFSHSGEFCI